MEVTPPGDGRPALTESPGADRRLLAAALLAGCGAFTFRILAFRGLTNDHYMHLAWAQQLLFHDLPGRDFVDPGMPLLYVLSALVQQLWAGPLAEALLTAAMLAIAASTTLVVVGRVTTLWIGVVATVFQVALVPRLYSYPKILVPAVALLLFYRYAATPRPARLLQLALWTGLAFLLRRDLGLMAALGCATGLIALYASEGRRAARVTALYGAGVLVTLAPYLIFLAISGGLTESVRDSVEFARSDAHQFVATPGFSFFGEGGFHWSWTRTDAAAVLSYASYVVAALSWLALYVARPLADRQPGWTTMAVGTIFLSLYAVTILRHPLVARVPDMAAVLPILSVWSSWALMRGASRLLAGRQPVVAAAVAGGVAIGVVFATALAASVWTLGDLPEKLRDTGVYGGPRSVATHVRSLVHAGSDWPWPRFWPAGPLPPVVSYLNRCTAPSDRVLLTWAAPEYYFFARRPFGGGHAWFLPESYRSMRDQELMIERLRKHRVPVALINETTRAEFALAHPRLDAYLRETYRAAGRFEHRDGSEITIAVRRDLQAGGVFEPQGWPCGFEGPDAAATGI